MDVLVEIQELKIFKKIEKQGIHIKIKEVCRYFKNVCLKVKTGMGLKPKTS